MGLDANPLLTATINAYGMVGASGERYTGLTGLVFGTIRLFSEENSHGILVYGWYKQPKTDGFFYSNMQYET